MFLLLAVLLGGCTFFPDHKAPREPRGEFEQLRGAELAQAVQMYREGNSHDGADLFRQLLADNNWNIRSNAVRAVGEVQDLKLLPDLYLLIEDDRLEVRESTSRVLQWMGDETSIPALLKALTDPEPIVRSNAAEALARIGGPEAVTVLRQILQTEIDPSVRAITASALGQMPDSAVVPILIMALHDSAPMVRIRAAIALGETGKLSGRLALEKVLGDPNPQVRASAQAALKRLKAEKNGSVKPP